MKKQSVLNIKGEKVKDKWNLSVHIYDEYDYTKFKKFKEYLNDAGNVVKSLFSSTLYNLAYFSMKAGVMKEYNIDIKFEIKDYEVIDN